MVRVLTACVYIVQHKVSGRVYVGKTLDTRKRWNAHRLDSRRPSPKSYLGRALKKHGVENFTFLVLETCATEDEAYQRERFWISYFRSDRKGSGYNLESGGRGGKTASEETRRKQSKARKGVSRPPSAMAGCHNPEARAKTATKLRGRSRPSEVKVKISAAHTGRPKNPEAVRKSAESHRGKPLSDDHRAKLSKALKGLPKTLEHRRRIGEAHRDRPREATSEDHRAKLSRALKGRTLSPRHRERLLRRNRERAANGNKSYLSSREIERIRELRAQGLTHKAIAEKFNVSRPLISKILRNISG